MSIRANIYQHWVYGGSLAGLLILALFPLVWPYWEGWLLVVFLQMPIYMLHQFEEHAGDRFRTFVNRVVCHGREALSSEAAFVINVPGVWGTNLVSLLLAYFVAPGYGLIAAYLVLVNALAHIQQSVKLRAYNPGVVTAILLFLPSGGFALWYLVHSVAPSWHYHAVGLGVAIAIHVGIILWLVFKMRTAAPSNK